MFNLKKYLGNGLKNTVLLKNNSGFSFGGPWKIIQGPTLIDRWYVGEISSVEYTISVEYDYLNREILKVLITGTVDAANMVVYSRCATNIELVDITATVNNSYIDVFAEPKTDKLSDSKLIFTGNYFEAQNSLVS